MKEKIRCILAVIILAGLCAGCGLQNSAGDKTEVASGGAVTGSAVSTTGSAACYAVNTEKPAFLKLRVGISEKVSIPDPVIATGTIEIDLMGKPNFEIDYSDSDHDKWTEESIAKYPNYLADLSFAGFEKPVFVSSYAVGDFTENTGLVSHIEKKTKKGLKESEAQGSCLALFVTEGKDSLDAYDAGASDITGYDCYIVILDYKNGVCLKTETDFFLHDFDYWVDYNAADVTGDGTWELLVSHEYNKTIEFGIYRIDKEKKEIAEVYSTFSDYEIDRRDFKGVLMDNYQVRLQYSALGYDKTVSMIDDGGYKKKDLCKRIDPWGNTNFVGVWEEDGSLNEKQAEDTAISLYTLDDVFLQKDKKGDMQVVFDREIIVGHRSETVGDMHAYLEYDKKSDGLVLQKVKYVNAKDAQKAWKRDKNYGTVRVVE